MGKLTYLIHSRETGELLAYAAERPTHPGCFVGGIRFEVPGGAPCRLCGGKMRPGIATGQTWTAHEDFGGDAGSIGSTVTCGGPGVVIPALKCSVCGHSITA